MDIKHVTERLAGCHMSGCATHQGGQCDCGAAPARVTLHPNSRLVAFLTDLIGEENPVLLRSAIENVARALAQHEAKSADAVIQPHEG